MILHSGLDVPSDAVYLPAVGENLRWGRLFSGTDAAAIRVDPGTEVVIDTISHEGIMEDQGRDPRRYFEPHGFEVLDDTIALAASTIARDAEADGPHVVTGPIEIRGAAPGDLLAMTLLSVEPRVPYGVISNRHGRGALPNEYPQDGLPSYSVIARTEGSRGVLAYGPEDQRSVRFPLAPFLGIMGVAVDGDQPPHSVPPGSHGGNLDIALLTPGSTLYLPVQVPGALAYVGDPHFAQGDGEVALTAMEAPLRARIRFDVIAREEAVQEFGTLAGPLARTSEWLIPTGLDPDLDVAVQNCVRAAIALLQARYGMDPRHAYAYLSAATDFNISQVVDVVKGVHARIRLADFA